MRGSSADSRPSTWRRTLQRDTRACERMRVCVRTVHVCFRAPTMPARCQSPTLESRRRGNEERDWTETRADEEVARRERG